MPSGLHALREVPYAVNTEFVGERLACLPWTGSETYFHSATRIMAHGKLIQIRVYGRYLDRWERRDGRWAIVARKTIFDFDETRDAGLTERHEQGARDRFDPSYAYLEGHA